jgi:glycosyltransferase involved in cell wall biosynthesis
MKNPKISVVLNVFKRSSSFRKQLTSIYGQSISPHEILVWENGEESVPKDLRKDLIITRSSLNFGVWARFAYALNATGDYICIFDDDTIPGSEWLENCYETIKKTPGLLGTRGLIFDNPLAYSLYREIGLYGQNDSTEQVDIVGHSWFFKKEWLASFWADFGNRFQSKLAGEDIHFSYVLQKHLQIPTLVPPHPINNPEMWGSKPELARVLGGGKESISQSTQSLKRFEKALQHYRKLGFAVLSDKRKNKSQFPRVIYFLIQKNPKFMHAVARKLNKLTNKI